jgi:predicted AAA+ superfamily ATPase
MLEILAMWNRWGTNELLSGIPRDITDKIIPYLHSEEIIPLTGPRRAGKSTVLYQLMDALETEKIPMQAMLHINFEEPKLTPYLNLEGLDELYSAYRTHVYPEGKTFLFLDEIQNVPLWERWVRARSETEDIKIFITGSSSKLMSRELASLLTGRHISFEVMPLSFREYLRFTGVTPPETLLPVAAKASIRHALNSYMLWGGFPKVVLAESEQRKRDILLEYFDDILFKDILLRHNIRDSMLLRHLVCHLLTQTGKLISFQRIANQFQVSNDLSVNYCNHAMEAYLVQYLPFYSIKASIRQRHPQKIHALDLGLRNSVSIAHSADEGHLIETLVYEELRRKFGEKIYYWKDKGEIDFVVLEGTQITHIYQVVQEGLDDEKIWTREIDSMEEAKQHFPKAERFLIAKELPKKARKLPFKIIPLWLFILEE